MMLCTVNGYAAFAIYRIAAACRLSRDYLHSRLYLTRAGSINTFVLGGAVMEFAEDRYQQQQQQQQQLPLSAFDHQRLAYVRRTGV